MSYYFRPPNSREQNLFVIRFSIDTLSYVNFTSNILNDIAYTSPAKVFLPPGFRFTYDADTNYITMDFTNAKYEIAPTINIQIKDNNPLPRGYNIAMISVSNTAAIFVIYQNIVDPLNTTNLTTQTIPINSDLDLLSIVGLQTQIIGRTTTGPTFAIANQGWTYVESTTPSNDTIYTSMNVGTNGVIPPFGLTFGGTYGYLGGAGSTSVLQNYTPTQVINNIFNYSFFPIVLENSSETITLPLIPTINVGQEIVLIINQNTNINQNNVIIQTANTNMTNAITLTNEGDYIKFIALSNTNGTRWVKINNK